MSEVATGSVLDQIRERRKQMQGERHVDIDIPGYQGKLVARYHPLDWDDMQTLSQKMEVNRHNPEVLVMISADGLANACEGLFFREGGELKPITHEGTPVRFDKGLATVLGIEGETVREIVRNTFFTPDAIVSQYGEFLVWQREGTDEDTQKLASSDVVYPTLASSGPQPSSE